MLPALASWGCRAATHRYVGFAHFADGFRFVTHKSMLNLSGRKLTGKSLEKALSNIDVDRAAVVCDLSRNGMGLADVPTVINFIQKHRNIQMVRVGGNMFTLRDLYKELASMQPRQDGLLDSRLTCASTREERQQEEFFVKGFRHSMVYDAMDYRLDRSYRELEARCKKPYERPSYIREDEYAVMMDDDAKENVIEAADAWYKKQGYKRIGRLGGVSDLQIISADLKVLQHWDNVSLVGKGDKRVLVLLVAKHDLHKKHIKEIPAKMQATKSIMQHVQNSADPGQNVSLAYRVHWDYLKHYTNFNEVEMVVGGPCINDELANFAIKHGVLCLRLDDVEQYYMQSAYSPW